MFIKYPRGSIFWAHAPEETGSSVQGGTRPVLIVSNNMNNIHSTVVTVVSLTSQTKPNLPVHVIIPAVSGEGINTVLCEQIKTIPKDHLKRYCGTLSEETMHQIEKAMAVHLNIIPEMFEQPEQPEQPKQTKTDNRTITKQGYTDEYKKQYLADAKKMKNAQLAKKYGLTAKAAWARTASWSKQFK